jgi:hypothetical protein
MTLIQTKIFKELVPMPTGLQLFGTYRKGNVDDKHWGVDLPIGKWWGGYEPFGEWATLKKPAYNNIGGNEAWLTYDDGRVLVATHCMEVLGKTGDRIKPGQMYFKAGNTGNAQGFNTHVQFKYKNGPWIDALPLLTVTPPPMPDMSKELQKKIDDLTTQNAAIKQQQDNLEKQLQEQREDLLGQIAVKQTEIQKLISDTQKLNQVAKSEFGVILGTLSEQVVRSTNLLKRAINAWGRFVDNHFQNDLIKGFLKYNLFVALGTLLSFIFASLPAFQNPWGPELSNFVIAAKIVISGVIGGLIKDLLPDYDTNKDGIIDSKDLKV